MDKIKRILLFNIPLSICNFRCHYCYLSQRPVCYQNIQPKMNYSPQQVAKALSKERLGGLAYMNFCAEGETLLLKDFDAYVYELVKEGHYAEIVTNLTITNMLDKILAWDKELLKRVTFKCSFHYLELKKKNLLKVFADNVHKIWEAGASANIEITPSDELIPYIDDVCDFSMKEFGALPHLTIARNDRTSKIEYLTNLTIEEYDKVWSRFGSEFWEFKKTIFMKKRKEFCYAGDWLLLIDLATGQAKHCYRSLNKQNIFENPDQPIKFKAIGKCPESHCYNGHALLTLGCIPHITDVGYGDIRNRKKASGGEWLQPELKVFFNSKLCESNNEYGKCKKAAIMLNAELIILRQAISNVIKKYTKG